MHLAESIRNCSTGKQGSKNKNQEKEQEGQYLCNVIHALCLPAISGSIFNVPNSFAILWLKERGKEERKREHSHILMWELAAEHHCSCLMWTFQSCYIKVFQTWTGTELPLELSSFLEDRISRILFVKVFMDPVIWPLYWTGNEYWGPGCLLCFNFELFFNIVFVVIVFVFMFFIVSLLASPSLSLQCGRKVWQFNSVWDRNTILCLISCKQPGWRRECLLITLLRKLTQETAAPRMVISCSQASPFSIHNLEILTSIFKCRWLLSFCRTQSRFHWSSCSSYS